MPALQKILRERWCGYMKVLWWVVIAAFFLGMGVGTGVTGWMEPKNGTVPEFSPETQLQTAPVQTDPTEETIIRTEEEQGVTSFPLALQYTTLVVEALSSYDGPWLEDGSEENVMGVAALLVHNTGTIGIEYARITLMQNGQEMVFDATYISPKGSVLLLEENKSPYCDAPVTQCRYRTVIPGDFDMSQREVRIEEEGLGSLKVTNLTEETMSCVRVFYKHHEGQSDLYVGGITYSVVIPDLQPGETRIITPYRYACGYALVVAVVEE